jgi:glycosyltransferase involved in cell wall biosynthesis
LYDRIAGWDSRTISQNLYCAPHMTSSEKFDYVSVVLPAYRLGEQIADNLTAVALALPGAQLVAVDDGSDDNTYNQATQSAGRLPRTLVLKHAQNRGKGAALQTGAEAAEGSVVIFLDGDLDLPPSQVPGLLDLFSDLGVDVLVGAKQTGMGDGRYPWKRRALSHIFSFISRILFRLPIDETQTGLKIFKRTVLDEVFGRQKVFGYAFDLELLVRAHRAGFQIAQTPVELRVGASSAPLQLSTLWEMGRDTLRIFVWSLGRRR